MKCSYAVSALCVSALCFGLGPAIATAQESPPKGKAPLVLDFHLSKLDLVKARVTEVTQKSRRWRTITSEVTEVMFGADSRLGDRVLATTVVGLQDRAPAARFYPPLKLGDQVIWAARVDDGNLIVPRFRQDQLGLKYTAGSVAPIPFDLRWQEPRYQMIKDELFALVREMNNVRRLTPPERWPYLAKLSGTDEQFVARWSMAVMASSFPLMAYPVLKRRAERASSEKMIAIAAKSLCKTIWAVHEAREWARKEDPKAYLQLIEKEIADPESPDWLIGTLDLDAESEFCIN